MSKCGMCPPQLFIYRGKLETQLIDMSEKADPRLPFKPRGLWTSTFREKGDYASGWIEWCHSEMPDWIEDVNALIITIRPEAKIYIIDTYDDLAGLIGAYPALPHPSGIDYFQRFPNWEAVAVDYDAVHLTDEGQWRTRLTMPYNLYGWDCESAVWFRNVFAGHATYAGKLVRLMPALPEIPTGEAK